MPAHHFPVGSSMTTLHLCSDGTYLYWVWSPASLNEKTQRGHSVFMDVFHLSVSATLNCLLQMLSWTWIVCSTVHFCFLFMTQTQTGLCVADILQERVILTRKEGESSKCLNELLLSRMSRFRASHSATLAALTGSAITNTVKEEQSGNGRYILFANKIIKKNVLLSLYFIVNFSFFCCVSIAVNTSCGLPLKTLRKTPMYVCGTYLVMLVSPPGVSGSSATRSLFGGTSSLSSLKSKCTHRCLLLAPIKQRKTEIWNCFHVFWIN